MVIKSQGLTLESWLILLYLSIVGDGGILSVGVKSVDIKRNTGGVNGYLDYY